MFLTENKVEYFTFYWRNNNNEEVMILDVNNMEGIKGSDDSDEDSDE